VLTFRHALQSLNLNRLKVAAGKFFNPMASCHSVKNQRRVNDVIGWRFSKNYKTIHKEPAL